MLKLLTALSHAIEGAPLIAVAASFIWGILSIVLSPCHLTTIPLIIGYLSKQRELSTKKSLSPVHDLFCWNSHIHSCYWRNYCGGWAAPGRRRENRQLCRCNGLSNIWIKLTWNSSSKLSRTRHNKISAERLFLCIILRVGIRISPWTLHICIHGPHAWHSIQPDS